MAWDVQNLFRLHSAQLQRFLRRRGLSADCAADLSQETFLRLLTATPIAPIRDMRAYIFRTASNLSIDLVRKQRLLPQVDNSEQALADLVDASPSPERVLLSRQELAIVAAALDRVPSVPREVFLARVDGRTFAEIGRTLGISPKTAFSQMVRVMAHLKMALDRARE